MSLSRTLSRGRPRTKSWIDANLQQWNKDTPGWLPWRHAIVTMVTCDRYYGDMRSLLWRQVTVIMKNVLISYIPNFPKSGYRRIGTQVSFHWSGKLWSSFVVVLNSNSLWNSLEPSGFSLRRRNYSIMQGGPVWWEFLLGRALTTVRPYGEPHSTQL